jgi:hypothetical protein
MLTKTNQTMPAEKIVRELIGQAEMEDKKNRRSEVRFPFFRLVSIQVDDHSYSAFTRDISASAIGLMHNMKLALRKVEIGIPNEAGQGYKLRVRIERCEPCGEGWYISSADFVGISV